MRHLAYKVVTPSRVQCCYNALGKGVIRLYPAHCITHVVNIEAGDTLETSRTERQIRLMTNQSGGMNELVNSTSAPIFQLGVSTARSRCGGL